MTTSNRYYGVVFVRNQRAQKCVACGCMTTRLVSVNNLHLCCECAVNVAGAINQAITRHADEARAELELKVEVGDATSGSDS